MPADLELDAPVIDDIQVDEPVQDDPIEGEGADDHQELDSAATGDAAEPAGDGRKLPQWIRDLKESSPAAYKEAKSVFFGKDALDAKLKDFDLDGIKGWLEEKGGRESLESAFSELESKATELDGINEAIATANPDLIKEIAELHPESFGKLAEATLNQWAQTHPEDYGRVMSGIVSSTLQSSGIPSFLDQMTGALEIAWALKGTEQGDQKLQQIAGQIDKLRQWTGSFGQAAKAPIATAQPKNDQAAQQVAQERQQINQERWLEKLEVQRKPLFEGALKDYIATRPDSAGTKGRAIQALVDEVQNRLGKDQKFVSSVNNLRAKGDIDGALKLVKSRESLVLEDAAKAVGEDFYGKLGPKAVAKPVVKPGQQQNRQQPARKTAPLVDPAESILKRAFAR